MENPLRFWRRPAEGGFAVGRWVPRHVRRPGRSRRRIQIPASSLPSPLIQQPLEVCIRPILEAGIEVHHHYVPLVPRSERQHGRRAPLEPQRPVPAVPGVRPVALGHGATGFVFSLPLGGRAARETIDFFPNPSGLCQMRRAKYPLPFGRLPASDISRTPDASEAHACGARSPRWARMPQQGGRHR